MVQPNARTLYCTTLQRPVIIRTVCQTKLDRSLEVRPQVYIPIQTALRQQMECLLIYV